MTSSVSLFEQRTASPYLTRRLIYLEENIRSGVIDRHLYFDDIQIVILPSISYACYLGFRNTQKIAGSTKSWESIIADLMCQSIQAHPFCTHPIYSIVL